MSRSTVIILALMFVIGTFAAVAQDAGVITYGGQAGSQAAFEAKVTGNGQALFGEGEVVSQVPFRINIAATVDLKILEVGADSQRRSLQLKDVAFRLNDQVLAQPEMEPMMLEIGLDGAVRSVQQTEAPAADPLTTGAADIPLMMILNQCLHFSAQPVSIGDTWQTRDRIVLPSGKELDVVAQSKLEGQVGNLLQITTVLDTPISMDVTAMAISMTGTLHGEIKRTFDLDRGMIIESKGPLTVSLTGKLGGEQGTPVSFTSEFQTAMKPAAEAGTEPAGG